MWLFFALLAPFCVVVGLEADCLTHPERRLAARINGSSIPEVSKLIVEEQGRAAHYLKRARELYKRGVKQIKGIDTTNRDPFIKQYEAQNQVLGALDLAPLSAETWIEAGKVTAMLGLLDEGGGEFMRNAKIFFAHGCKLDMNMVDKCISWAEKSGKGKEKKQRSQLLNIFSKWQKSGVPKEDLHMFANTKGEDILCNFQGQGKKKEAAIGNEAVANAIKSFKRRVVFPMYTTFANLAERLPVDALVDHAVIKYREWTDGAFQQWQPLTEMSWTKDFESLRDALGSSLDTYIEQADLSLLDEESSNVTIWLDVDKYNHQEHRNALAVCLFFVNAPEGAGPLALLDPRGEREPQSRDPQAPFHRREYVFPKVGDVVCLPPWLAYHIPPHGSETPRVVFTAVLQTNAWDPWQRSAVIQ